MMAATLDRDRDTSSGVTHAPHLPVAVRNVRVLGRASSRQRPLCEVRMGSLNVGTMERKPSDIVEMMKRWKMEILTVCTGDAVERRHGRKMAEGYKMLHAGGDGSSNGVGIIVNVENSKEVTRVER